MGKFVLTFLLIPPLLMLVLWVGGFEFKWERSEDSAMLLYLFICSWGVAALGADWRKK